MGEIVGFRQNGRKMTGFIPADLGRDTLERRHADQLARDREISLIAMAKMGAPPIISAPPNHPETFTPDDCA